MQEFNVTINYDICNVCEDCIDACNENVFELDSNKNKVVVINEVNCNGCKDCIESCLVSAIYVGETLEKMEEKRKKRKKLKKKRDILIKQLLEKATQDKYGDYRLPLKEVMQLLDFSHEEHLVDWLRTKDEFIGYIESDEVVIESPEMYS